MNHLVMDFLVDASFFLLTLFIFPSQYSSFFNHKILLLLPRHWPKLKQSLFHSQKPPNCKTLVIALCYGIDIFHMAYISLFFVLLLTAAVVAAFPATLKLERAFPPNHGMEMSELRSRDILRHRRHLQQQVYDFPVKGNSDPFILGLYYTKVLLGSPPKEFYVQIDTGSDDLWVSCTSCIGCPQISLQIDLNYFDSASSSTSTLVSCLDQRCHHDLPTLDGYCDSENRCAYTFHYGDGSVTSGYYISDLMHFANISEGSTTNSSTPLVFGCSNLLTGAWTTSLNAIDGIFGLGQHGMFIISQLSSQGIAPRVFPHCLKGDIIGGGILVLGEIVEPDIIYTPLVPSQPHYNLYL